MSDPTSLAEKAAALERDKRRVADAEADGTYHTEYRDWTEETSMMVSGPIGRFKYPGRSFPNRAAARDYWLAKAGKIIREYKLTGRWAFRVPRPPPEK